MNVKIGVLLITVITGMSPCIHAGDLQNAHLFHKDIQSIECDITYKTSFREGFQEENRLIVQGGKIKYRALGDLYFIDMEREGLSGSKTGSRITAWDGTHYQLFSKVTRRLEISVKDRSNDPAAVFFNPLLLQNIFFSEESIEDEFYVARLTHLLDSKRWLNLVERSKVSKNVASPNKTFLTLKGPKLAVKNNSLSGDTTYEVVLNHERGMLADSWLRLNSEGKPLLSYEVVEWESIKLKESNKLWYYPKTVLSKSFSKDGSKELTRFDATIENLKINSVSEELFTLDPGIAATIYDADSDKIITVAVEK